MKKGEFRASNFIISIIFIIAVFGVLWGFNSKLMVNYGVSVPSKYNETFQIITNTSGIDSTLQELKASSLKDTSNRTNTFLGKLSDKLDVIGLYFKLGYETMSITPKSMRIFTTMSDSVLDSNTNLLGSSTPYINFLIYSLILVGFIFLLVAIIIKWWV